MIDRIRLTPAAVFLNDAAVDRSTTVTGYTRHFTTGAQNRPKSIILILTSDRYKLLVVVAHKLDDGPWRVACVDLNLPSLVFGHNGRPIRTAAELALALTRACHFLKLITEPSCHGHLVPGVGSPNYGFIKSVECTIQIQDPGHRLLTASHMAALPYQHKPALVCWGQSTLFMSVEIDLSIYDKAAQRRAGTVLPYGSDGTRFECKIKKPERLAQEVTKAGNYVGGRGEVVRTLAIDTCYAIVRRNVGRMTGWGVPPDMALLSLPTAARLLAIGLGIRISKPHAVDKALADYCSASNPCDTTRRNVAKHLRGYAMAVTAPKAAALLPEDMDQLLWSDLSNGATEQEYKYLLSSFGAPMEPCPAILDAWSQTSFHRVKPAGLDIVGRTAPIHSQSWRRNVL